MRTNLPSTPDNGAHERAPYIPPQPRTQGQRPDLGVGAPTGLLCGTRLQKLTPLQFETLQKRPTLGGGPGAARQAVRKG